MRQIHTILTKNTFFKKDYGFLKNSFTYKYQIQQFDSETPIDGWNLPFTRGDILHDLIRWKLMDKVGNIKDNGFKWINNILERASDTLCATYPPVIVVPSKISDL